MDGNRNPLTTGPAVHSYRDSSTILGELVTIVGFGFGALIVQFFLGTGKLHLDNGKALTPTFAFHTLILVICVLSVVAFTLSRLLRRFNERIEVYEEKITWRNRLGRVVECPIGEVTSYRRTWNSFIARPRYVVGTPAGEIRYSHDISRLAELNRFFTALSGVQIPEPLPSPRHWEGSATYSGRSTNTLAFVVLALFLLGEVWMFRQSSMPHRSSLLSHPYLIAMVCIVALGLEYWISKYFFESVKVEKDELIYRSFFGRELVRVKLDEIQSIDVQPTLHIAKVYTPDRMFRITQNLRGYQELVEKLQWMTASPNP